MHFNYWASYFGYTEEEIVKHDHLASNIDLEEGIKLGYVVNPKVVTSKYLSLKQNGILENIKEKVENEKDQSTKNSYERIYQHMRRKVMNAENVEQLLGNNIKKGGKYIVFCPVLTESGEELEDEKGYAEKTNKNKLTGEKALKKYQQDIKEMLKKYYNVTEEEINKMISFNLMLGSQSDSKNNKEKFNFEKNDPSKIKFMTVMNILNEGVHMDNIDGIIWLRPLDKESKILFLQQFGRIIHGVEPNKKLSDEDIPIAIDLVDNIYNVELEKTKNKTNDIDRMIFIKEWINYHNGKIPDINSEDQTESNYAKILKQIKEEYTKYLDQKTIELLYPQKQIEVKKILKLGQDINLWTHNFQEKMIREKAEEKAKDHQIGLFSLLGEVKDYIKIESLISLPIEDKVAEYIEMLNDGYVPKYKDQETEFCDGSKVNYFWSNNKDRIVTELETNPKYETGYEKAKETLKNYLEKSNNRSSLSVEDRIVEYIEMLNEGYVPKFNDSETEFSDGSKVNTFWPSHKDKIKEELETNPKYETGYETAKETLKNYFEKRSSLSVEDKVAEYIEMLNEGYVPKFKDQETGFSDGSKVNQFWSSHREKVMKELEANPKYETGYEKAKETLKNYLEKSNNRTSLSVEDRIAEYIEMLNEGYVPKFNDSETEFSDGSKVNFFWPSHKDKIKEELETNPKYETGYEKAKETLKNYLEKSNNRSSLSVEDKVAEYIEMLNDGYVPKHKDRETGFSDGSKVNQFWSSHRDKIKEELETNPKYETGYEKAKETLKNYLEKSNNRSSLSVEDKVAEYIEMLNKGYIPKSNDIETEFSDGSKVNYFWPSHKDKIKEELETNPKYETGYEKAKETLKNYLEKSNNRSSLSLEDRIIEYIEMLNKGYIPKSIDKETEFSDGSKVNYFWSNHKDQIKEELETNPKYETGYEKAKETLKNYLEKSNDKSSLSLEDRIAEYIEMLNKGYIPKSIDKETEFSDGSKVNQFWSSHKDKIKEELETNLKYEIGYEKAKETLKNYFEKLSRRKIKSIKSLVDDNENNKKIARF